MREQAYLERNMTKMLNRVGIWDVVEPDRSLSKKGGKLVCIVRFLYLGDFQAG